MDMLRRLISCRIIIIYYTCGCITNQLVTYGQCNASRHRIHFRLYGITTILCCSMTCEQPAHKWQKILQIFSDVTELNKTPRQQICFIHSYSAHWIQLLSATVQEIRRIREKYIGPKLETRFGRTRFPYRQPSKNLNIGAKQLMLVRMSSTTTSMPVWCQTCSNVAATTPSFCTGDRLHVLYTTMPPGRQDRIPALQTYNSQPERETELWKKNHKC